MANEQRDVRLICRESELKHREIRRVDLDSESVMLLRIDNEVHCFRNRCPHRGTELDWTPGIFWDLCNDMIQCSTHGARFDPRSGLCVTGPCKGESLQRVQPTLQSGDVYLPATL
jgi:nitrite reductase/ring-hydroxylating ferredoxin subunit